MSNDYDVYHDGQDWVSKKHGASRASSRHDTQKDAYDATRGYLERSGGGDVAIHRKDNNEIRDKNTIGKSDPHPPKGSAKGWANSILWARPTFHRYSASRLSAAR